MGKGGDINARWATNTNGVGSGGAGDGPGTRRGGWQRSPFGFEDLAKPLCNFFVF